MDYAEFMMRLQESVLFNALPDEVETHPKLRKTISGELALCVTRLVAHLRPDTVLEIGAHEAGFARAAKARLPASRVVAFEANPAIHERYAPQVSAAGVEYLLQCVADEDRTYRFAVPRSERELPTMGSILRYTSLDVSAEYDVEGVRLDTFLAGSGGSTALWIDVEGAIGSILAGAAETLGTCVLLFAEVEARERWGGQMLEPDVFRLLSTAGLMPILRDIQRHKWQHNVLFVREGALADPFVQRMCFDYLKASIRRR